VTTTPGPTHLSGKFILRGQLVGFSALIALMWLAELLRVPQILNGQTDLTFAWSRAVARSLVVLLVWLPVHITTKRLLRRLHQLEEFLLICSWCRKVGDKGEWLSMEDYFGSRFSTETSHGICPACAQQQLAAHRAHLRCEAAPKPAAKV
jgi:hypothetical protein